MISQVVRVKLVSLFVSCHILTVVCLLCSKMLFFLFSLALFQFLYSYVYEAKEKTSQYIGVSWHKQSRKWHVKLHLNGGNKKYGGNFRDEMDAAKRVNQLCKEFGILEKNPGIGTMSNRKWKVTQRLL